MLKKFVKMLRLKKSAYVIYEWPPSYCQPQHKSLYNIVMPINLTRVVYGHTELMKNDVYYETYCIAINTIFASLLPFVALMFFNVRIALKLRFGKRVSAFPRVSVQGVKSLGGHFACLCRGFEFYEVK